MKVEKKFLVKFPRDSSPATAGVFLHDENILVTGHDNGLVYLWNLSDGSNRRLFSCASKIHTIACSSKKELVIGSHYGDLAVVKLDGRNEIIKPATGTTEARVWRCEWIDDNKFVMTSTYGEVAFFARNALGNWNKKNVYGHSHSVFGVGLSSDGLLATGDYRGNILLWNTKDNSYPNLDKLQVSGTIQGISWFRNELFSAMSQGGRLYLFDRNHQWKLVSQIENATSFGSSVCVTTDGETVFAGTSTEIIQFDMDSLQSDSISISGTIRVFNHGNTVYVLTDYGFLEFERKPVDIKIELVKFKYVKIAVVGHTQVGKSTLCSFITTNSPGDEFTTLGKKVWTWELPEENRLDKRIMLYDYGGQETALSTFIPFLLDSDIILILFNQIDRTTLDRALRIYDALARKIAKRTKIFLVQTHIDHPVRPEMDFRRINQLIRGKEIIDNLKVSPSKGTNIAELKSRLLKEISWDDSRTMIQNVYSDCVLKTILVLQEKNTSAITLDEFMRYFYKENPSLSVSKSHIKFLLKNYSNQGIIEYNHKILDLIIINDPEYNRLKAEVPISVMQADGIAPIAKLSQEFKDSKYFPAIDAMYLKYKIAIENYGQRIFPELLKEEAITIPNHLTNYFKDVPTETKLMPNKGIATEGLIEALSELKLRCINASKNDGLFSYGENAILYYRFENTGSAFDGFFLKANYRIGGKVPQICERLRKTFLAIIEQLYGPFQSLESSNNKKKVDTLRELKYDVAISYAHEQRAYAEGVYNALKSKGIAVFFDKALEAQMWGRDMGQYLSDIYYNQSRYCIMIISKSYVSSAWPTHERQNAIARQIKQMGDYILPVRFDDSVVPGLTPTINYIRAQDRTPQELANFFMKKLEPK